MLTQRFHPSDRDIDALQAALEKQGVETLTKVAILTGPCHEQWLMVQALERAKAQIMVMDVHMDAVKIAEFLKRFEPEVLFLKNLRQLVDVPESLIDGIRKLIVKKDLKNLDDDETFIATLFSPPISSSIDIFQWKDLVRDARVAQ